MAIHSIESCAMDSKIDNNAIHHALEGTNNALNALQFSTYITGCILIQINEVKIVQINK